MEVTNGTTDIDLLRVSARDCRPFNLTTRIEWRRCSRWACVALPPIKCCAEGEPRRPLDEEVVEHLLSMAAYFSLLSPLLRPQRPLRGHRRSAVLRYQRCLLRPCSVRYLQTASADCYIYCGGSRALKA
jgi:hypothetical protein